MSDDPANSPQDWLAAPLAPNAARIHAQAGEGAAVSPAFRAALDTLLAELQAEEVSGYATPWPTCPDLKSCSDYICAPFGKCTTLQRGPCLVDTWCKIANIAR